MRQPLDEMLAYFLALAPVDRELGEGPLLAGDVQLLVPGQLGEHGAVLYPHCLVAVA